MKNPIIIRDDLMSLAMKIQHLSSQNLIYYCNFSVLQMHKYANNFQVCKCESMLECNASMKICKYASMQVMHK